MDNKVVVYNSGERYDSGERIAPQIICIAQWKDGSFTSFVTDNDLYDVFHELDGIHNPDEVEKIWAAKWSFQDKVCRKVVDTSGDPTLVHVGPRMLGIWRFFDFNKKRPLRWHEG